MSNKKIIFLGTGAPEGIKYYNACLYIKEGKTGILVDTGGGNKILEQLQKAKIKLEEIKYIFITHKHIDHVLGVFWILRFLGAKIADKKADNLTIFCSQEVGLIIKNIASQLLKTKVLKLFGTEIKFVIINNKREIEIGDWKLNFFNTNSPKDEQFGLNLEFKNKTRFVSLGDEPYNKSLYSYCYGANYFLHEAFCLDTHKSKFEPRKMNHVTVKEAALSASNISVENLILWHTEDKTFSKRKKRYINEARKYFKGNIFVPDDLDIIVIK